MIDFTGAGVDADLILSGSDVQNMTDGGNSLTLEVNAGDSLAFATPGNVTSLVSGATTTYSIWTDATHTTLMATLIENVS